MVSGGQLVSGNVGQWLVSGGWSVVLVSGVGQWCWSGGQWVGLM